MSRNTSVQEKPQVVNVTEAVTYSRRGKVYEATLHGAKVAEADTRSQAEFCLIEAASPRLAGMIRVVRRRAGAASGTRAQRGARIVLAGGVYSVEGRPNTWSVDSESEAGQSYQVTYDRGWYCECEDWQNGWAGKSYGAPMVESNGIMCKHAWAAKMVAGLRPARQSAALPQTAAVYAVHPEYGTVTAQPIREVI